MCGGDSNGDPPNPPVQLGYAAYHLPPTAYLPGVLVVRHVGTLPPPLVQLGHAPIQQADGPCGVA